MDYDSKFKERSEYLNIQNYIIFEKILYLNIKNNSLFVIKDFIITLNSIFNEDLNCHVYYINAFNSFLKELVIKSNLFTCYIYSTSNKNLLQQVHTDFYKYIRDLDSKNKLSTLFNLFIKQHGKSSK